LEVSIKRHFLMIVIYNLLTDIEEEIYGQSPK
jgi:hypothetical protein